MRAQRPAATAVEATVDLERDHVDQCSPCIEGVSCYFGSFEGGGSDCTGNPQTSGQLRYLEPFTGVSG